MNQRRVDRLFAERPMAARLALHVAAAMPTRTFAPAPLPPLRRVWNWWLTAMTLALASAAGLVLVWQVLRRGML